MAVTTPAELRELIGEDSWPQTAEENLSNALRLASTAVSVNAVHSSLALVSALERASTEFGVNAVRPDDALEHARTMVDALASVRNFELQFASVSDLARALARDPATTRYRDRARELARSAADSNSIARRDVEGGDLLEVIDWTTSIVYGLVEYAARVDTGPDPLSPNAMPTVALSPVDDERMAFERLWSLVERSIDTDKLSKPVADEIVALNKLLGIVRHELDPDRHGDLFDDISTRLSRLLPDVLEALLGAEQPIPQAIQHLDAPIDDQLGILAEDLELIVDTLEGAAASIDADDADQDYLPPPQRIQPPFGGAVVLRLNTLFGRLDTSRAILVRTKTGRSILNGAAAVATGAATAAATPIGDYVSAGSASLIAGALGWLYTRLRRLRPELPALNLPGT